MSLPSADLFPDFIVLTSPHERSADPIPRIFEVTLQATNIIIIIIGISTIKGTEPACIL